MPYLSKQTILSFLCSECLRRLKLDLSPDNSTYQAERTSLNVPPRVIGRPGFRGLADAGSEWEFAKINDLVRTFGIHTTLGIHTQLPTGGDEPDHGGSPLQDVLSVSAR